MKEFFRSIKEDTKLTYVFIFINVTLWLITEVSGGSTNSIVLLRFGALFRPFVIAGELWRLISSAFLHIGIFHLLVNTYTLYSLGEIIENFFGQRKFFTVYILTAVSASLVSIVFSSSISAGASGALFGLSGLLLGNYWAKKTYVYDLPINERQLIPMLAINLIVGATTPMINNYAHIGGLIGGVLLGFILDPTPSFDPSNSKKFLSKALFILSCILLATTLPFWILSMVGRGLI